MGRDVRFGSLADLSANISLMSASGGTADVFRFNFGNLRLNVPFSRKRTFNLLENYSNHGQLSANSGS